jgi:Protein of unknown function (DUF2510)
MSMTQSQSLDAGWYQDPQSPPGVVRYWDGQQWTPYIRGAAAAPAPAGDQQTGALIGFGLFALAAIGAGIAMFTNVSLLTGTGTVWTGVVIACVAAVGAMIFHRLRSIRLWVRVVCGILAGLAIASAAYDENQLQQRRDEINQIVNNP